MSTTNYSYILGIDPSINTCGTAVYSLKEKKLVSLETVSFVELLYFILTNENELDNYFIVYEDARKRNFYGKGGTAILQGAGSIKGTCKILEESLKFMKLPYTGIFIKNGHLKKKAEDFKKITGYDKRTSSHSRDASMLIYSYLKLL